MTSTPASLLSDRISVTLFAGTLLFSALLMFTIQPLLGKLLLPHLGGAANVWNTCMLFYQSLLFLGYAYAHWLTAKLPLPRQHGLHLILIAVSLVCLPIALPDNLNPPTQDNPFFWLTGILLMTIGLPFFVLATTSPLLQKWFSQLGHRRSADPYYLYAASNAGSLLALLSYPFLIEPGFDLPTQTHTWSLAYVLFGACVIGAGYWLLRQTQTAAPITDNIERELDFKHVSGSRIAYWLALGFIPSSLLLSLTQYISTDIAAMPLLWVLPLAIYLTTFIIAFSSGYQRIAGFFTHAQVLVLPLLLAFSFINPASLPFMLNLGLHGLAFFLACQVCHGQLALSRPDSRHLTAFYLILGLAGMLGGWFVTFIAPWLFDGIVEYPLLLTLSFLLRPGLLPQSGRAWLQQLAWPLAISILGFMTYITLPTPAQHLDTLGVGLILLAGLTYAFRSQPITLGGVTGVLLLFAGTLHASLSHTLFQERNFYGVVSVRQALIPNEQGKPEKIHELYHGTTKHGSQRQVAPYRNIPYLYYSQPGPMGQLFSAYGANNDQWQVGVVGLGAGALLCYRKPAQHWTVFELDPLVVKTATNTDYFSYWRDCAGADTEMVLGDARLSLTQRASQSFDLLIIDAFSSDSVPAHLLTREAIALYLDKLTDRGLLAFHITNRHLDLLKVLAVHVQQDNIAARVQQFRPREPSALIVATDWMVLAKHEAALTPLDQHSSAWQKPPLFFNSRAWDDNFSALFDIWKTNP
ncbi:MAG: fused MFS/spermidine synthase [Methylococcales bacterium]|nr:fused MFS/spermidine synthase [Methylococcales bacterium]